MPAGGCPMIDYFAFGNVVIDDIVRWDGRTALDTLGGASAHALAGMRVWAGPPERPRSANVPDTPHRPPPHDTPGPPAAPHLGCVAVVGPDFPAHHRAALAALGIDLRGLTVKAGTPTPRAWQRLEADGQRVIAFRTSVDDFIRDSPPFEAIPPDYLRARGAHLYWSPAPAEAPRLVERLRRANPGLRLVWEPSWLWADSPPGAIAAVMPLVDLVTPDAEMAAALTGQATAAAALATFRAWGAPLAAIRMGAAGSLLGDAAGRVWQIPAVPVAVVDVTGAGNAYGGGFLVGLGRGAPPVEAALMAAVSASFALEQFGLPRLDERTAATATARLAWARRHVKRRY